MSNISYPLYSAYIDESQKLAEAVAPTGHPYGATIRLASAFRIAAERMNVNNATHTIAATIDAVNPGTEICEDDTYTIAENIVRALNAMRDAWQEVCNAEIG